jgi:pellino
VTCQRPQQTSHTVSISYNYGALSEYGAPLPTKEEDRIVFEYVPDPSKDMFQVGRVATNDFIVKGPLHYDNSMVTCGPVSRYACRIELERKAPFRAFVYAAGFNATKVQYVQCCSLPSPAGHITCYLELKCTISKLGRISYIAIFLSEQDISLGVSAPKWFDKDASPEDRWRSFDALTTYGVKLWRPELREWCEISVQGNVFRPRTVSDEVGERLGAPFSNQLTDGSIIDICGVVFLFQNPVTMAKLIREHVSFFSMLVSIFSCLRGLYGLRELILI